MSKDNKKELQVSSEELDLELANNLPVEAGYTEKYFPRISFTGKDVTEEVKSKKTGKKEINIITEGGMFLKELQNPETKEFEKTELGTSIDVTFVFERKQLKFYDSQSEEYVSSPIYDNGDDIIPLFKNKKVVAKGTVESLMKDDEFFGKDGKTALKVERVCYVLFKGDIYQLSIRGSSVWAYKNYKKTVNISTVITTLSSTAEQSGSNNYNKMSFEIERPLSVEQKLEVLAYQKDFKQYINDKKEYFAQFSEEEVSDEDEDITEDFKVEGKGMDTRSLPSGKKKQAEGFE